MEHTVKAPIIIIGIGEIGGVLARGFLRLGHPVYPVVRDSDMNTLAAMIDAPALVVVAVGEAELQTVLANLPTPWRLRVALLQNELLPGDWQIHLTNPSVISLWFEKKRGQDVKVLLPSPAYGPRAGLLRDALAALGIPVRLLNSQTDLLFELVAKNLYILTTNIAGLEVGGDVSALQTQHEALMLAVADDVLTLQQSLTGQSLDRERLISALRQAIEADPEHRCMGRSAPARLSRALHLAHRAGLQVPTLQGIADTHLPKEALKIPGWTYSELP